MPLDFQFSCDVGILVTTLRPLVGPSDKSTWSRSVTALGDSIQPFLERAYGFLADWHGFIMASLILLIIYWIWSWILNDYQEFMDLGPGGTEKTPWGWWRINRLGLFRINVYKHPHVTPDLDPFNGILDTLPQNKSPRPSVQGIAPQRQTPRALRSIVSALEQFQTELAARFPERLEARPSYIEGGRAKALLAANTPDVKTRHWEFKGEISHVHKIDGSLHCILHPDDVKTVIEKGWGERHPLARSDWWWKFYFRMFRRIPYLYSRKPEDAYRPPVPAEQTLIYAPMGDDEVEVVKTIIKAACWWVTGFEYPQEEERARRRSRSEGRQRRA